MCQGTRHTHSEDRAHEMYGFTDRTAFRGEVGCIPLDRRHSEWHTVDLVDRVELIPYYSFSHFDSYKEQVRIWHCIGCGAQLKPPAAGTMPRWLRVTRSLGYCPCAETD